MILTGDPIQTGSNPTEGQNRSNEDGPDSAMGFIDAEMSSTPPESSEEENIKRENEDMVDKVVKKEKKDKKDKKDKKHKKSKKEKKEKKSKKDKKSKKEKKDKHRDKSSSSSSRRKTVVRRTPVKRAAGEAGGANKRRKVIKLTEDDFEPVNRWWEKPMTDEDGPKWNTLEHRGLLFTPEYEPHHVPLVYSGADVPLPAEAEEVATFFAQTLGTDWCTKPKFCENFWSDFTALLPKNSPVKKLELCDFSKIKEFLDNRSVARKARSREEKEKETESKKEIEHPFTHAIVDDLRERVGNFRTEPQNLFRGRGEHPKMGMLKKRILPEDVTINMGMDAPIPRVDFPPGHAWRDIVHDNTVTWLAWYHDSINGMFKYMFLNAASGFKGQSDWEKYERARRLKKFIAKIRTDYEKKLRSNDKHDKNLGTVAYLIDRLALRVGNEKNVEEEADTVGCCSLRVEHIRFEPDHQITLDFLGKDSIRYLNTVTLDAKVYTNLQSFVGKKKADEMIFDIDPEDINKYFKSFMPDLSAKVFRTYNASITLESELYKLMATKSPVKSEEGSKPHSMDIDIDELTKLYNEANRRVAILCNHQRAPPKQHESGMATMRTKFDEINNLINALKQLKARGKHSLSDEHKQSLEVANFNVNGNEAVITRKIHTLMVQSEKLERTMEEKEENKSVSLTTSKINYMDPRISVAFCKRVDLPIERVFAKTIRNKFPWAMHTKSDWMF